MTEIKGVNWAELYPLGTIGGTNTLIGVQLYPAKGETVRQLFERITQFNAPSVYPRIELAIPMPCGEKVFYPTLDAIPETDVPCTCGNPNHWFIKIERNV